MASPLAIIDIDGVVADVGHRLHHLARRPKDWDAFFAAAADDPLLAEGVAVVERLAADHEIVFLTGRPARLRAVTAAWLEANGLGGHRLVMREREDRRPAAVTKRQLVAELAAEHEIGIVVDDDPAVLEAIRGDGHPTFLATWQPAHPADEAALRRAQEVEGRT